MSNTQLPSVTVSRPGWVRFSLPIPEGVLTGGTPLSLSGPSGELATLQTRTLATWGDGSVRWLDCQSVTAEGGEHRITLGEGSVPGAPVTVSQAQTETEIGNGELSLAFGTTGPSPISRVSMGGADISHRGLPFEAVLRPASGETAFTSAAEDQREVKVVERGPVRAVVVVTGRHAAPDGSSAMAYRLRTELIAGQPTVVLRYRFFHHDPGVDSHEVRHLFLRLRWQEVVSAQRHLVQQHCGMAWQPREVLTAKAVDIRSLADHPRTRVADPACWDDPNDYAPFMPPRTDSTRPYLGVAVPGGWATVHVEDFEELCPSGLSSDGSDLTVHVWPEWAGSLTIPQGRSRETTLRLVLTPGDAPPTAGEVTETVAACTDSACAALPVEQYAQCGCWDAERILPVSAASPRRFDRHLARLARMPAATGFWDLGDMIDPGYSHTYTVVDSVNLIHPGVPPVFQGGGHGRLAPWADEGQFERVWTNNEYDAIAALCREWLRGNQSDDLWQRLRWFARHAVDVDFVGFSDYSEVHHGTPAHSAGHGRATAYPSHLWCEGLLAYYCLTGDDDALDAALKQGEFIIRAFAERESRGLKWQFSRELGWALLHLAVLADFAAEQRFRDEACVLADRLLAEPLTPELTRDMTTYAFGYASVALGVEALWRVTPRRELAEWLLDAAERVGRHVLEDVQSVEGCMVLIYFTSAYAVKEDPSLLQPGMHVLEQMLDSPGWGDPSLFPKPVAMRHRSLARFLWAANRHGLLDDLDYRFYPKA